VKPRRIVFPALSSLAGIALAVLPLACSGGDSKAPAAAAGQTQLWTCSMHPQVRLPAPGRCPICGMQLVPVASAQGAEGSVVLGPDARRIAGIETLPVGRQVLARELRAVGRIEASEPRIAHLTARVDGRVERLFVDFVGVRVAKGDHLVDLFAPDLVVAQQEFLRPADRDLARQKLDLLGVTKEQIDDLERSGRPSLILTVHAPIGGTVLDKQVRTGSYVKTGDPLYTIADLSTVWLYVEVYEPDLPWLRLGQEARAELDAAPGETFGGRVAFVEPTVRELTRTTRVRINLPNPDGRLKPGMFARVVVKAALGADGRSAAPVPLRRFACQMHPDVDSDTPGKCDICGMALVERPAAEQAPGPAPALLDTGVRRVVYVEHEPGRFAAHEVVVGPRAGDFYPVLSGLSEGDKVVVDGGFLLDSQAQIEGKPSLLFPGGSTAPAAAGHAGHEGHR
jgi:Cu(I)/Ag(I) efflux system membrane fusion protein